MRKQVIIFLLIIMIHLSACSPIPDNERRFGDYSPIKTGNRSMNISANEMVRAFQDKLHSNKCGYVHLSPDMPIFNITGSISADTIPNATIYMSATPNVTLENSLYVTEHCFPLWKSTIINSTSFTIVHVPPGKYVIYLPSSSFPTAQGFPLPDEFNKSGYELDIVFHGGNYRCNLGVFEIRSLT